MQTKHTLKPFIIILIISVNILGQLLFADEAIKDEDITTADQAYALADKYKKMVKHYEDLALKLSGDSTKETTEDTENDKPKPQAGGHQTLDQIAQEQAKSPFSGTNASLGYQYNTGNTFQRNISAATNVSYQQSKKVLHTFTLNYQNAYDYNEQETITNKLYSSAQSEYDFDPKNGIYANIQYLNDQNSGYVYKINENIGYKRNLFSNNSMDLDLFVGPGLQQTRQTQETGGDFENDPTIQVKNQYKWKINDKTNYNQTLQWIKTPIHYTVSATLAFVSTIYNSFGLQPSFTLTYDSNPPTKTDGTKLKKLDTTTQVSLVYNF